MSSYKEAGVDISAGNAFVEKLKPIAQSTFSPAVLFGLGGFGACFSLKEAGVLSMEDPILVASTDGVGTKLKIAVAMRRHFGLGIDLVAMAVNDLSAVGARPLFLLDYLSTSKLQPEALSMIVQGIAAGCRTAECSLIGGETAEMPGVYAPGEYDLSACAVGVVERKSLPDPARILPGDVVVGLASSGFHSNGFSLVREVVPPEEYIEALLTPTLIYHKVAMQWAGFTKGMAHITGGGLIENIPRMLPEGVSALLDLASWPVPMIIQKVVERGGLSRVEAHRVFNMGLGWVGVFSPDHVEEALRVAAEAGFVPYEVGQIVEQGVGPRVELL